MSGRVCNRVCRAARRRGSGDIGGLLCDRVGRDVRRPRRHAGGVMGRQVRDLGLPGGAPMQEVAE
ncbi:hypothetical protein GCM10022403_088860 [Streptomyces coacervatus]|uniref:Uncharacterized protein n=1 Tax=Streptomyces coacervatus TaxID=647381 RepID=A0ABP7JG19_9ACTN